MSSGSFDGHSANDIERRCEDDCDVDEPIREKSEKLSMLNRASESTLKRVRNDDGRRGAL